MVVVPRFVTAHIMHIPTGRVFFEHVLLFLITEHGVVTARPDWRDVVGQSLDRVSQWATWGRGPTAPPAESVPDGPS